MYIYIYIYIYWEIGILYDILSLTRGRHCSGLGGVCAC